MDVVCPDGQSLHIAWCGRQELGLDQRINNRARRTCHTAANGSARSRAAARAAAGSATGGCVGWSCAHTHVSSGNGWWVTRRAEDKITPKASFAAPTLSRGSSLAPPPPVVVVVLLPPAAAEASAAALRRHASRIAEGLWKMLCGPGGAGPAGASACHVPTTSCRDSTMRLLAVTLPTAVDERNIPSEMATSASRRHARWFCSDWRVDVTGCEPLPLLLPPPRSSIICVAGEAAAGDTANAGTLGANVRAIIADTRVIVASNNEGSDDKVVPHTQHSCASTAAAFSLSCSCMAKGTASKAAGEKSKSQS